MNKDGRERNPLAAGLNPAVRKVFEEQDRRRLSSTELAKRAGWPKYHISQWRNGSRTPNIQQLVDVANALDLQVDISIKKKQ